MLMLYAAFLLNSKKWMQHTVSVKTCIGKNVHRTTTEAHGTGTTRYSVFHEHSFWIKLSSQMSAHWLMRLQHLTLWIQWKSTLIKPPHEDVGVKYSHGSAYCSIGKRNLRPEISGSTEENLPNYTRACASGVELEVRAVGVGKNWNMPLMPITSI